MTWVFWAQRVQQVRLRGSSQKWSGFVTRIDLCQDLPILKRCADGLKIDLLGAIGAVKVNGIASKSRNVLINISNNLKNGCKHKFDRIFDV